MRNASGAFSWASVLTGAHQVGLILVESGIDESPGLLDAGEEFGENVGRDGLAGTAAEIRVGEDAVDEAQGGAGSAEGGNLCRRGR